MRAWLAGLGLLLAATGIHAETKQQIYDRAQTAFDRFDWPVASAGFAQLLPAPPAPLKGASAVIAARLAEAELKQDQYEAARGHATRAVAGLADNPEERAQALITLGNASRLDLMMPEAIAAFSEAAKIGNTLPATRAAALIGLAQSASVYAPDTAAAALATLVADPKLMAGWSNERRAQVEALQGRAELNRGDFRAANRFFDAAVRDSGSLTSNKVSMVQVALRGDAAIASQMLGYDESARKYLAFSGAGHVNWDNISRGNLQPPVCGQPDDGPDAIQPDDTAVVEFSIGPDGEVTNAMTIFASRPGPMGIGFARAVRDWSWRPSAVAKLNPFWRALVRMQLRCITRPAPESIYDGFQRETRKWFDEQGLTTAEFHKLWNGDSSPLDANLAGTDARAIAALMGRNDDTKLNAADRARLDKALDATNAPANVRALILFNVLQAHEIGTRSSAGAAASRLAAALPGFAARWPNSEGTPWLRLSYARALESAGDFNAAQTQLEMVLATPVTYLPEASLIRSVATVHLAALHKRAGDTVAAMRLVTDAGLSAEQCALFDLQPVSTAGGGGTSDFPEEALSWGFDGYVLLAYDIGADGRTTGVRAVVAYPPFIFDAAATKVVKRLRYLPPVLDGSATGCNGARRSISFKSG
ncbi:hypothetical protein EUV02_10240 [Polymorphobacter arshaanensis]|uniref:TonB C-terminal domain-containing protein n=1 Tax=Glacieibacterium arshaanense TaxID=2511025 RepID=A0A4Y9ENV4_9SPHN|nr:energy transducer TonB [Polymorphobacter arshaanensis]TFU03533.1 hypothetical protein EUV02_10240 [Polymorphobacter arshaanensis]